MINYITDQGGQRFPKAPNYNNEPIVPSVNKEKAKAGDILLAKANGQKMFVTPEMWTENKDLYENIKDGSDPLWTPIGVVVVPYTHTPDGTVRCCALTNELQRFEYSSYVTEIGDTTGFAMTKSLIYYRMNTDLEDLKRNKYSVGFNPTIVKRIAGTSTISECGIYFVCDGNTRDSNYGGNPIPYDFYDIYATAHRGNETLIISPYSGANSDRSDEFYANISRPDSWTASLDLRMDGKGATKFLFDVYDKWYKDSVGNLDIEVNYSPSPALGYMKNYSTTGTTSSDWYIPSVGELAFFYSRNWEICNASILGYVKPYPTMSFYASNVVLAMIGDGWSAELPLINNYITSNIGSVTGLVMITTGWNAVRLNGTGLYYILPFISV